MGKLSIVAVTTDMANDDTQWLVYWTCFATMYLVMLASDDILYWTEHESNCRGASRRC